MQSQAYFENISSAVILELEEAVHTILISAVSLTDAGIFELLCRKAQNKVRVELVLGSDKSKAGTGFDFDELREAGGTVIAVGNSSRDKSSLLNRFCVIDGEVVITGSYGWAPTEQQYENMIITRYAPDFSAQFVTEFRAMHKRWERKAEKNSIDLAKVLARIEALRGVIHADDEDDIAQQLIKLKNLVTGTNVPGDVQEIILCVEQGELDEAETLIMSYLNTNKKIAVYVDPELGELKLELKSLEVQISALENEKQEIDRTLHAYQYRHTIELGDLMRQILLLSKEILRKEAELNPEKEAEFEEAQREYEEFEADFKTSSEKEVASLSPEEQQEIKAMFRACTKLCHPDVVADEYKDEAAETFHKLAEAYDYNDMDTVKEVYRNLQKGIFAATSDTLNDVQRMHRSLVSMRSTLSSLAKQIRLMRNTEVYREIAAIADWDEYFASAKQQMQDELARLKGFDDEN